MSDNDAPPEAGSQQEQQGLAHWTEPSLDENSFYPSHIDPVLLADIQRERVRTGPAPLFTWEDWKRTASNSDPFGSQFFLTSSLRSTLAVADSDSDSDSVLGFTPPTKLKRHFVQNPT